MKAVLGRMLVYTTGAVLPEALLEGDLFLILDRAEFSYWPAAVSWSSVIVSLALSPELNGSIVVLKPLPPLTLPVRLNFF